MCIQKCTKIGAILLLIQYYVITVSSSELRIYEGAPKGTRITIDEELEYELENYRDCFFQLETNITWFYFNEESWSFETTAKVTELGPDENVAVLHLLCANAAQSRSIEIKIQTTRPNRFAPEFSQRNYIFYVPLNTKPGEIFGKINVIDRDPVTYNAQLRVTVLPNDSNDLVLDVEPNGNVKLKKKVFYYTPFKAVKFKLSAIDFGSPQKHAEADLTFIPVTITQARRVTVNVANVHYQIYEWDSPAYGTAESYRLIVRNKAHTVYNESVNGQYYMAYFKRKLDPSAEYSLQIEAIDADGKTPSNMVFFQVHTTELTCEGSCSGGGNPVCYFNSERGLQQYVDENGGHCLCFQGYSGISCGITEECNEEETVEVFGRIRWTKTAVNNTQLVPCPFGAQGDYIKRRCNWDTHANLATWQSLAGDETCRKQNSVLNELNLVSSHIRNTSTSHASAVDAADRVVDQLLREAAFMPNITNVYFDGTVAEHMTDIVANTLFRNWRDAKGNYTDIRKKLIILTKRLAYSLPIPYSISSLKQKLAMKAFKLLSEGKSFRTAIGNTCAVEPEQTNHSNIIRAICMEYAKIFLQLDENSPVLIVSLDRKKYRQPLQIQLKPHVKDINFTCVRYDEKNDEWTNDGIELLETNRDDFVVCRTEETGHFSLLPVSYFQKKYLFEQILLAIPVLTAILAALGCILMCIISLIKRKQIDRVVSYLFLLGFCLHLLQAILFVSPNWVTVFRWFDNNLEITLYFLSISIIFTIAYLSFALHSYLVAAASQTLAPTTAAVSYIRCSIVFICVIAIPLLCTISFSIFKSNQEDPFVINSMDTKYSLHYLIPTTVTFCVIFVYCILIFKQANRLKKRYRYTDDKVRRSADIIYAVFCILFLYLTALCDTALFLHRSSLLLTLLHCIILVLFTVLCCLLYTFLIALCSNQSATESPTRSLERKRDISRGDLLDHDKNELLHFPLSDNSLDSPSDIPNNIFHSQIYSSSKPMVSIV